MNCEVPLNLDACVAFGRTFASVVQNPMFVKSVGSYLQENVHPQSTRISTDPRDVTARPTPTPIRIVQQYLDCVVNQLPQQKHMNAIDRELQDAKDEKRQTAVRKRQWREMEEQEREKEREKERQKETVKEKKKERPNGIHVAPPPPLPPTNEHEPVRKRQRTDAPEPSRLPPAHPRPSWSTNIVLQSSRIDPWLPIALFHRSSTKDKVRHEPEPEEGSIEDRYMRRGALKAVRAIPYLHTALNHVFNMSQNPVNVRMVEMQNTSQPRHRR